MIMWTWGMQDVRRIAAGALIAVLASTQAWAAPGAHSRPKGVDLDALFRLFTHQGGTLDRSDIRGRPVILVFGYTNCPEVCPTTLLEMSSHLQALGAEADRVKVLFVTVDPERDTVDHLKLYLSNFDSRIVGLTGRLEDVEAVAEAFGTSLSQQEGGDGYYSVNHSASTFMIDKYGLLAGMVAYGDGEALLDYSRRLLAQ
jgi:protein SCO1/2